MGRKKMPFWMLAALAAMALPVGFLLFRGTDGTGTPNGSGAVRERFGALDFAAGEERIRKQSVMDHDIAVTGQLCRLQCKSDLSALAGRLHDAAKPEEAMRSLEELRRERPHIRTLAVVKPGGAAEIRSGTPVPDTPALKARWRDAVDAAASGRKYESRALTDKEGHPYFVLAEPAGDRGGVIALIRQDVMKRVANHQARNLRLREFPDEDRRFGIRAVDPKTGKERDVDSPEENEGMSHYRKHEVVVRFQQPPSERELARIRDEIGAVSVKRLGEAFVFESSRLTTKQLIDYFGTLPVVYAEPHYMYVTNEAGQDAIIPNDELYRPYQWNLPAIATPEGWTISKGAEEVVVAVVDTGVTIGHPDLAPHLVEGFNVIAPERPPADDVGHGTHVAGVVSALTDNGQGIAGMTWYNKVMPVKALDSTGMGSTYSVAEGIVWATDRGAKVINLSLGNYASAAFLHDAIRYAFDRDVVLIAATGNDSTEQPGFPAAYPEVFAVSATNRSRKLASFSNYGDYVDVVAPGETIASTYTDNQYAALSGTSMASPHVAALAALIRSVNPGLKNTEVYDLMRQSSLDLGAPGKDPYYGYGQIDVARALALASGNAPQEAASDSDAPPRLGLGESLVERVLRSLFGM